MKTEPGPSPFASRRGPLPDIVAWFVVRGEAAGRALVGILVHAQGDAESGPLVTIILSLVGPHYALQIRDRLLTLEIANDRYEQGTRQPTRR